MEQGCVASWLVETNNMVIFIFPFGKLLRDQCSICKSESIVNCRVIIHLMYYLGPPGTGKTSLCKALAQKLSIRLSNRLVNLTH